MVRSVASRYCGLGLSLDDLVQEGCIGLLDAIDRYDPDRHVEFDAFARFRVRRAIKNALTDQGRLLRLPKHVVARQRLLARVEAAFLAAHGRPPTTSELAAASGLSERAVTESVNAPAVQISLDTDSRPTGVRLHDENVVDPEAHAATAEETALVRTAVEKLSPRDRHVIRCRYGLGSRALSVADVAADLGLSERRARSIEHDAVDELAAEMIPKLAVEERSRWRR
jgi:RNA polymerase sigma factor (sigma-70 family)